MAAGAFTLFSKNKDDIRINDIVGATVKAMLVTSAWTPDSSVTGNSVLADVSGNEIANGNGYTTGGVTLASLLATAIAGGFKFSSGNAAWTAAGGAIPAHRYLVLYISGALWGMTSPLIGYVLVDTTPADTPATADGAVLTYVCNANGWFDAT